MRLQLEDKGDNDHTLTNFGNIVVAFAFVTIPVIGWLLDKKVRLFAPALLPWPGCRPPSCVCSGQARALLHLICQSGTDGYLHRNTAGSCLQTEWQGGMQ